MQFTASLETVVFVDLDTGSALKHVGLYSGAERHGSLIQ
jgi:hypothetical protein